MIKAEVTTCAINGSFRPDSTGAEPITPQGLLELSKSIREDIIRNEALRSESLRLAAASIMK